ncbi:hypothetical protein EJ06DRAFT_559269 [Trichodelitschia bisporula]|uniref:MARVEL domain-containing protein n=1 Tax=Trichodelitschia bisporula TaxID=703511 RepID=A0A6G1HMT2_9PEZI|nr:hypothetical protein EJ06DRAFT_559269 [Trichodelitschia bisporula]
MRFAPRFSAPSMSMPSMPDMHLPLRAAQAGSACIVLGLTAYVANWWSNYWHDMSPLEINFLIFTSGVSLLSTLYLAAAQAQRLPARIAHPIARLIVDTLTMGLWLGGSVRLLIFLKSRVCFGNVCNVAKAAIAFSALSWWLFVVSTAVSVWMFFRARARGERGMVMQPKVVDEA